MDQSTPLLKSLASLIFLLIFAFGVQNSSAKLFPLAARLPIPGTPSPPGSPWPLPQQWINSTDLITIAAKSGYSYSSNVADCEILNEAFRTRFSHDTLFQKEVIPDGRFPTLSKVQVNIATDDQNQCKSYPTLNREKYYESYNISVRVDGGEASAVISAFTVWGALHGLETYSELIWQNSSHYYVNVTQILDWPRFPHRGLMIDTARHYISPDIILKILDGMSYNKLNVLHWHIVDDQSFPFVSQRFPELSEKGAYIPGVLIYDPPTVESVIEYAKSRGIRVMLEFDTPGHTLAFGLSHLELLTPCYGDGENPGTPGYPLHAPYEILDPTKETTYTFMREFFSDVYHNVSKDEYLHLGMDEVYYHCWNSSKDIKKFMEENNYTELYEVQQHYTRRHLEMIESIGAKAIVWQDPLDFGVKLDKKVIVQIWKGDETKSWQEYLQEAVENDYDVILSSCWYLNYINYGESWKEYYQCDPAYNLTNLDPARHKQILGGEAAVWAEYVDNKNIIPRLFPFVSAVAERLWSAANSSTTDDAKWRLDEHRCRMLGRELEAQPIFNGYCSESERRHNPPPPPDKDSAAFNYLSKNLIWSCFITLLLAKCLVMQFQ